MKYNIANGARGYICADGDLYLEGYEKEQGGSSTPSSIVHGVFLKALQRERPDLIRDVDYAWQHTTDGVTIQRLENTNEIYLGQSVLFPIAREAVRKQKMQLKQMLLKSKIKNPRYEFFPEHVDDADARGVRRELPGKEVSMLAYTFDPRKVVRGPIHNKFKQGVYEEKTLQEKFLTMARFRLNNFSRTTVLMSVYLNPDADEMKYNVAVGARGFLESAPVMRSG